MDRPSHPTSGCSILPWYSLVNSCKLMMAIGNRKWEYTGNGAHSPNYTISKYIKIVHVFVGISIISSMNGSRVIILRRFSGQPCLFGQRGSCELPASQAAWTSFSFCHHPPAVLVARCCELILAEKQPAKETHHFGCTKAPRQRSYACSADHGRPQVQNLHTRAPRSGCKAGSQLNGFKIFLDELNGSTVNSTSIVRVCT